MRLVLFCVKKNEVRSLLKKSTHRQAMFYKKLNRKPQEDNKWPGVLFFDWNLVACVCVCMKMKTKARGGFDSLFLYKLYFIPSIPVFITCNMNNYHIFSRKIKGMMSADPVYIHTVKNITILLQVIPFADQPD